MSAPTGIHPYADKFPMLSDAELDDLADSIVSVGLVNPIVVDRAGLVLDGRNRLEACSRAGVEARTTVYEGNDPAEFVIACNVTRRNMSTGARAMATALVLEADGRRENGRWKRGSVDISTDRNSDSGWRQALHRAGVILDFKPDLAADVIAERTDLATAFAQAEAIRTSALREEIMAREKAKREKAEAAAEAEYNAQIVADLTQAGADNYLALIDSESMTPKAAWAAYREDTRKERERFEREREVLRDRYTSMANACLTASSWGEHEDLMALMADYEPALLSPPQLERYLTLDSLLAVQRFAEQLIEWRKSL